MSLAIPHAVLTNPAYAESLRVVGKLMESPAFAASPRFGQVFHWQQWHNNGMVLRERPRQGPVAEGTPLEQYAFIVAVGVISQSNLAVGPAGNFKTGHRHGPSKAKYGIVLGRPTNPVYAATWDRSMINLHQHVELTICQDSVYFFVQDKGQEALRMTKPLFEVKGAGVEFKQKWPAPSDVAKQFDETFATHDVRVLPAYDKTGRLIPPNQTMDILNGATVKATFRCFYYKIERDGSSTNSLTAEIARLDVMENGRPPPAPAYRVKPGDWSVPASTPAPVPAEPPSYERDVPAWVAPTVQPNAVPHPVYHSPLSGPQHAPENHAHSPSPSIPQQFVGQNVYENPQFNTAAANGALFLEPQPQATQPTFYQQTPPAAGALQPAVSITPKPPSSGIEKRRPQSAPPSPKPAEHQSGGHKHDSPMKTRTTPIVSSPLARSASNFAAPPRMSPEVTVSHADRVNATQNGFPELGGTTDSPTTPPNRNVLPPPNTPRPQRVSNGYEGYLHGAFMVPLVQPSSSDVDGLLTIPRSVTPTMPATQQQHPLVQNAEYILHQPDFQFTTMTESFCVVPKGAANDPTFAATGVGLTANHGHSALTDMPTATPAETTVRPPTPSPFFSAEYAATNAAANDPAAPAAGLAATGNQGDSNLNDTRVATPAATPRPPTPSPFFSAEYAHQYSTMAADDLHFNDGMSFDNATSNWMSNTAGIGSTFTPPSIASWNSPVVRAQSPNDSDTSTQSDGPSAAETYGRSKTRPTRLAAIDVLADYRAAREDRGLTKRKQSFSDEDEETLPRKTRCYVEQDGIESSTLVLLRGGGNMEKLTTTRQAVCENFGPQDVLSSV
ncbi:hypothetical protein B0H12DRAFT_1068155 [Mycena haematopus]|nr:hypothetical protein B0H12DRAFT_1068155 [Mycena haematopus]